MQYLSGEGSFINVIEISSGVFGFEEIIVCVVLRRAGHWRIGELGGVNGPLCPETLIRPS